MTPEFKVTWCKALRSRHYAQCTEGYLRYNNTFCCLGVALDLLKPNTWTPPEDGSVYHMEGRSGMPSDKHCETIGITVAEADHLAQLNDNSMPFTEIANYIEANL